MKKTFSLKLVGSYFLIILMCLGVLGVSLSLMFRNYLFDQKEAELIIKGTETAGLVKSYLLMKEDPYHLIALTNRMDQYLGTEVWVVDEKGLVLAAASYHEYCVGSSLDSAALTDMNSGQITVRRGSAQYFADPVIRVIVPVSENNQIIGAVLVYSPIIGVEQAIMKIVTMILYAAAFALIIAVLVGIVLSRSISRPLQTMSEAAIAIAKGKKNIKVEVNSDLAELRQFEQTFNYMSEKIDENEMRMKDFVSNVSHELRSPLTAMKGFIEALIDKKAKTPEEQDKYLQIIHRETDHLSGLVADLLALSSAERNVYARAETIDVREFLQHELVNWSEQARTKQIRVALDETGNMEENEGQNEKQNAAQDPLWIRFDPHALKQVLLNLVDNAIKYSKANTEIQIRADREGERVRISVKDQGPGIPEADLPYIWDRFYRVDKARTKETGGTGLGLAIVKQLVENNQGSVHVESSKEGSVFSFTAPRAEENGL